MVVYVVHTRRERRGWRGGDSSSAMTRNLVRLANRPITAAGPAIPSSTSCGGRSLSRAGGRSLRAASPPPPSSIWESRSMRREGDEDWQEDVAAGSNEETEEQGVLFGAPPTDDEVRAAVASIKQVFENPSALDSDVPDLQALALPVAGHPSSGIIVNHFALDSDSTEVRLDEWIEPAMLLNSSAVLTKEHRNVLDAFQLLHEDSSVQKMVMALSTDKAVWDAVMSNQVVQEFKKSFQDAKEADLKANSTAPPGFMMWVLENTQAKIKEFLEKILGLMNVLFQAGDNSYDLSDDLVRMSFMLSVFVFIVVTIARIR